MIELRRITGRSTWVNPKYIVRMHIEDTQNSATYIHMSQGDDLRVKDHPEDIIALIQNFITEMMSD